MRKQMLPLVIDKLLSCGIDTGPGVVCEELQACYSDREQRFRTRLYSVTNALSMLKK